MLKAPELKIPTKLGDITEEFVQSSYAIGTEYLKSCFTYIFNSAPAGLLTSYTIGTWSFKIKPSQVRKHGTAEDIANLPPPTNYNQKHKTKRKINPGKRRAMRKVAKSGTGKRYGIGTND